MYKDILANSKEVLLSEVAKIGDFVDYDAGIWGQDEISIGSNGWLRFPKGESRSKSIEGSSSGGWRVIEIENDAVTIIHAGVAASGMWGYQYDDSVRAAQRLSCLNSACETYYLNKNFATSSSIPPKTIIDNIDRDLYKDLVFVGQKYAVNTYIPYNYIPFYSVKENYDADNAYSYGEGLPRMRPVVTLKSKLLTSTSKTKDEFGHDCWVLLPPQETQGT